jgi:hypothetical protein
MTRCSWHGRSLGRVEISPEHDEDDAVAVLDALAEGLERDEPFALLVVMPQNAPSGHQRRDPERMAWLKRARPSIAARCRGMAYVLPGDEIRAVAPPADVASRLFGCAVASCDDEPTARAWIEDRIAAEHGPGDARGDDDASTDPAGARPAAVRDRPGCPS